MLAEEIISRLQRQEQMSVVREALRKNPELRYLYFELTDRCNLHCLHCGSSCGEAAGRFLDAEAVIRVIQDARAHSPNVHICLTGGEPLLHPQFEIITEELKRDRLFWSVVTNATLIDRNTAARLRENGVYSVSVSLDGEEAEHNRLRQSEFAYRKAVLGIQYLLEQGIPVQVTTVATKRTVHSLDRIYETVKALGVSSWKVINIEPIGRAVQNRELLLTGEEFFSLLDFIAVKRAENREENSPLHVTYGCSHLLPLRYEEEVRRSYFLCCAGITAAGIRSNGDIAACLDIERRPELVQGNIARDSFWEVWENKFQIFRTDRTEKSGLCRNCELRQVCAGDSLHTWDFEQNEPRVCLMKAF